MEIIVLVKQVPDTETMVQIAEDGATILTQDIKWVMNPYDEFAVEEALRMRDTHGGTVTIMSLGPQKTAETIRTALAMGADRGVHINDPAAEGSDALGAARILTAALKDIPHDVVIAGQRAVDDDCYQVGAAVAEFLNIPQISMVVKQQIENGKITCEQTVDGGIAVVEAPLPVLLTTQRGLNEPRYASLPGIMKAKKKPLEVRTLADLGIDPATVGNGARKVTIKSLKFPPKRKPVRMVQGGDVRSKAAELVRILHEEYEAI